jgi:hypothetical protein
MRSAHACAKFTPFIPLTGSVAHLYSSVPTVVEAKKGVKEKKELGETTVTTLLDMINILIEPTYHRI